MPPNPLAGTVTRPDSFDPTKDYAVVIARGDEWLGDYDINDAQLMQRYDQEAFSRLLVREGAVVFETGGTIAPPVAGVILGSDALGSAGEYVGVESQLYTVTIGTGGLAGVATYSWKSTGGDNPDVAGTQVLVRAIAPDLVTALADLATYGHAVGLVGVQVVFVNPNGFLTAGNSWVVQATYGARAPIVDGNDLIVPTILVPVKGRVHRVVGARLTYPALGSGFSTVYGEFTRVVVTHTDDPTLRDLLSDTPQAWRARWRMVLRTTDTSAAPPGANEVERRVYPLYRWDRATNVVQPVVPNPYAIDIGKTEGALDATRLLNVPKNELLRGYLAKRTSGAHGSFVVAPLPPTPRAQISTNPPTAGKIRLTLPPITASVEGVDVELATPTEVEVDQATDTALVTDEPFTYAAADNPFVVKKAQGERPLPIHSIVKVTALVQVGVLGVGGYEQVTRGGGTDDALLKTPVTSILRISNTQGGAANYTLGVHYSLVGNGVHWISGAPSGGASYYVAYQHNKTMVPGADYVLATNAVDFSPGGDNPVEGSQPQVDYRYYLPRHDAIVLRPNGAVAVVKGLPAELPEPPDLPQLTLPYVRVEIAANGPAAVRKFSNDRVTMETLNQVIAALDELTRNTARLEQTSQASARTSSSLLDILVDAFATLQVADQTYNAGGHVFDATIDTETGELTLPFTQSVQALARVAAPGGDTDVRVGGAFMTLPYAPELAIDAGKWSVPYPVNPYADFRPEPPSARLEPSQDVWVDTTQVSGTATRIVQNGRHINFRIVGRFTEIETRVTEIPALFMRQIAVRLLAFHCVPGERIRLLFDGKVVPLTAVAPTTQGPDAFTVIARAPDASHQYGDVVATFTVPANVPVGTVPVDVYGDGGVGGAWPGAYVLRTRLTYSSAGVRRETATELVTVLVQNDPIAQSVVFPQPRMIARVDLPLAAKPANGAAPLVVEVRGTDRSGNASTPINEVLAAIPKEPADLAIGVNSASNASNQLVLADPVMAFPNEFRSIVLRSASNAYQAYVAQLGGPDRVSGGFIQENQIPSGIFMDSSNNVDWTPRQGWDLRFKVWVAKMSALEAKLYYGRVTLANMTALFLNVDQVVPDGTSIEWQYSTDGVALGGGGKVWTTFQPFTLTEFSAVAATLDVRAILRSSDPYVTPAVHRYNTSALIQQNKLAGKYVSTRKTLTEPATAVRGSIELLTPSGGTQAVLVSLDDGATWSAVSTVSQEVAANGFTLLTFEQTVSSGTRLRARVDQTTADRARRPRARRLTVYAEPV